MPAAQVLPGDLYFLGTPATHVGIVVGAGLVLDASASHGKVVLRKLWTDVDITFGRVPRPTAVTVTGPPPTATDGPARRRTAPGTARATHAPRRAAHVTTPRPLRRRAAVAEHRASWSAWPPKQLIGARYQAGGNGPAYDDGDLVAAAWHQASGGVLPLDRNAARRQSQAGARRPSSPWATSSSTAPPTSGTSASTSARADGRRVPDQRQGGHRKVFTSPDLHYGRLR